MTPPLALDHLALIAPSLEEGVAYAQERLGLAMPAGGRHPQMGTHNHLLRLGDALFLEVIAVDPHAPAPARPRWFGLDDAAGVQAEWDAGRRLRGWVARTADLDGVLAAHEALLGRAETVSRGDRHWRFAVPPDGSLPAGGAPSVMDWGPRGTPAPDMPDLGVRLLGFAVEHPDPHALRALYRDLAIADPPEVRAGPRLRYTARLRTPGGVRELD